MSTNCPGCDWYAREALYILGRMEAKSVDGTEGTARFIEQSRQRCRDASLVFPQSPRGKQCLKEVNEYLEKVFAFLEEKERARRVGAEGLEGAEGWAGEEAAEAEAEHARWAEAEAEAAERGGGGAKEEL